METENSEVRKMIHEGAEVYLNGEYIGNGEAVYEVETPYEEVRSGEWGPETLTRPTKRTFKITIPEGAHPLQGDWIVKRYTPDGNIRETAFSDQEEASRAMQLFREFGIEGHFELVCRPRVEDVVVTSYRNEPEEETLDKPELEEEPLDKPELEEEPLDKPEDDSDFDREKTYRDSEGDIWNYLYDQGKKGSGWYFQEEEGGPQYGPCSVPLVGPHEEVEDEEESISEAWDLLKSKRYLDRYDCVWEYRIHQGNDRPAWHYRIKGDRNWGPRGFYLPVAGPWTEYEGED